MQSLKLLCHSLIWVFTLFPLVATSQQSPEAINAETVMTWADQEFGKALEERRFVAAAVSVVKDGELLFTQGYGHEDLANNIAMNPETSKVRICSNSKLFTATALMQLIENGSIGSLDDDANQYLKRITLPDYNGRQITLRDLTTHRGGIEDSFYNAGTTVAVETPVDGETLEQLIPSLVREPGTVSVYSNATLAVQGAVIEDVTGMTLADYIAENILEPLGMSHSVLDDNPPRPKGSAYSHVLYSDGSAKQVELVAKHPVYAPSGGMFSTAVDMSEFLIAHLNGGANDKGRILSPEAVREMQTQVVSNHPALSGHGVQFFTSEMSGQKIVDHGCGLPGFTSYSVLLPDQNVGMFVSVVSSSETLTAIERIRRWLFNVDSAMVRPNRAAKFYFSFLKTFVGYPPLEISEELERDLDRYAGTYKVERRSFTNVTKIIQFLSPHAFMLHIKPHEDGGLSFNGGSTPYRAVGEDVFQRGENPAGRFAFRLEDGKATMAFQSSSAAYTRVAPWFDVGLQQKAYIWSLVLSLTAVGFLLRFYAGVNSGSVATAGLLIVLFSVVLLLFASAGYPENKNIEHYINEGGKFRLVMIAILGNLIALSAASLSIVSLRKMFVSSQSGTLVSLLRKAHLVFLALAGFIIIFVLTDLRLVGLQLPWM